MGTSAKILVYTGTAPTNADTAATGTLLATLTGNATAFGTVSTGVLTVSAVTSATAVATGTAGYVRIQISGSTTVPDLTSVGTSGADVNFNTTSITSGGTVSITSGTITEAYLSSTLTVMSMRPARVSLSGTTTYYLIAQAGFTAGAVKANGSIIARRQR